MNVVINVMNNHRSIRKYKNKDIPEEVLDTILKAAQSMPNSVNAQQISIIAVRDKETKAKLSALVGNQKHIAEAPVVLVFAMDFYKTSLAGEKAGKPQVIQESLEGITTGALDVGIAYGAAVIAAESLGLGIGPTGGVKSKPLEVIELLGLPKYTFPLAGMALGYPDDNPEKKPRMPLQAFKHKEKYNKEALPEIIDKYDEEMGVYLEGIGRKEAEVDWSTQTSKMYKQVYYSKVKDALEAQGFKLDK
ncbi:NADPH-dependent oxidoreductase [Clostridium polynesiense]|uniref:NADPH-dependent oxidoreductase n=1 Tax=Clostridium polynesiense TaxID=1325933 RepID=UPI00058C6D40|nr:NADPH-dependent oxidoreductase [Clostridium polynesiense]